MHKTTTHMPQVAEVLRLRPNGTDGVGDGAVKVAQDSARREGAARGLVQRVEEELAVLLALVGVNEPPHGHRHAVVRHDEQRGEEQLALHHLEGRVGHADAAMVPKALRLGTLLTGSAPGSWARRME